jgi:hypothetical protein
MQWMNNAAATARTKQVLAPIKLALKEANDLVKPVKDEQGNWMPLKEKEKEEINWMYDDIYKKCETVRDALVGDMGGQKIANELLEQISKSKPPTSGGYRNTRKLKRNRRNSRLRKHKI